MLLLPMGDRFSVDDILASLRARREPTVAELADRAGTRRDTSRCGPSPCCRAPQLFVAYVLNAVQKTSDTWKDGSAIYYVMMSERTSTAVACAVRDFLPRWASIARVRGTLVIEYAAPVLIASPFGRVWSRRVAIALLWACTSRSTCS